MKGYTRNSMLIYQELPDTVWRFIRWYLILRQIRWSDSTRSKESKTRLWLDLSKRRSGRTTFRRTAKWFRRNWKITFWEQNLRSNSALSENMHKTQTVQLVMKFGNMESSNGREKCNIFQDHLVSVSNKKILHTPTETTEKNQIKSTLHLKQFAIFQII